MTSELQTSETIAHRVVTSRLTAAGSGGGAGSMLAAGTSVKIAEPEDDLIRACCECSDCILHVAPLERLAAALWQTTWWLLQHIRPHHAARQALSHEHQCLTAHCGHSQPPQRESGTQRQVRATACDCMGLLQPSTAEEPAAGPLQPRVLLCAGQITYNWRHWSSKLSSEAWGRRCLSKPAWQEQPVRTLDVAKAAQPL